MHGRAHPGWSGGLRYLGSVGAVSCVYSRLETVRSRRRRVSALEWGVQSGTVRSRRRRVSELYRVLCLTVCRSVAACGSGQGVLWAVITYLFTYLQSLLEGASRRVGSSAPWLRYSTRSSRLSSSLGSSMFLGAEVARPDWPDDAINNLAGAAPLSARADSSIGSLRGAPRTNAHWHKTGARGRATLPVPALGESASIYYRCRAYRPPRTPWHSGRGQDVHARPRRRTLDAAKHA